MNDFKVDITYKNRQMETVATQEYSFEEYTEKLKQELLYAIADVEEAFVFLTNTPRESWNDVTNSKFQKIRHRLLDQANAIQRLPKNLKYKNLPVTSMVFGDYLNKIFNDIAANDVNVEV